MGNGGDALILNVKRGQTMREKKINTVLGVVMLLSLVALPTLLKVSAQTGTHTDVKFTLPTKLDGGNCLPGTELLRALDSVKVWYHVYGTNDTLLAFSAFVIRMEGSSLSVAIPSTKQTDVWVKTHNNIGWSCPAYLLINAGVSVPWQPRYYKAGVVYDIHGAVADTTRPGVYFITLPKGKIRRTVIVK